MNTSNNHEDQAKSLRDKIMSHEDEGSAEPLLADTLPSRKELHRAKKPKTKWKIKYPAVRLLLLLFILLLILIPFYNRLADRIDESTETAATEKQLPNQEFPYAEVKKSVKKEPAADAFPDENDDEGSEATTENDHQEPSTDAENDVRANETRQPEGQGTAEEAGVDSDYKIIYHKVQPEETLYRISMKYYGNRKGEDMIRRWNGLNENEITAGQTLQIPYPAKDSK